MMTAPLVVWVAADFNPSTSRNKFRRYMTPLPGKQRLSTSCPYGGNVVYTALPGMHHGLCKVARFGIVAHLGTTPPNGEN
jgi:hypothetical protein